MRQNFLRLHPDLRISSILFELAECIDFRHLLLLFGRQTGDFPEVSHKSNERPKWLGVLTVLTKGS